jgi:acetolactate synthase-1/2/3 large subunit
MGSPIVLTCSEPGASKIIDLDPVVIRRNYKADVALVGDAKLTLQDLLGSLKTMIAGPTPKRQHLDEFSKAVKEYQNILRPMIESDAIPIKPQRIMKEISKVVGPRDIVVSDTNFMICWTTRFLKMKGTGMIYLPCGGTLGSSFAMAIGVVEVTYGRL